MRRSLMSVMLAAAAIAALGVVPAMAAAESYIYDHTAQKKVPIGTEVGGVSGNTTILGVTGPHTYDCQEITYSGEVTKNAPTNEDAEVQLEAEDFNCSVSFPGIGTIYRLEFVDLAVSARQFFPTEANRGQIDYWIDSGVMNFYLGGSLHDSCTLKEGDKGKVEDEEWEGAFYSLDTPPQLSLGLFPIRYDCWGKSNALMKMTGSFLLNGEEGQLLSVVVIEDEEE